MVLVGRRRVVGKDICAPFRMGQRAKGRLQPVSCYRARDETDVWISGIPRQIWVSRRCLLGLGSGPKQQAEEEC